MKFVLSEQHKEAVRRKRRVIMRYDAFCYYELQNMSAEQYKKTIFEYVDNEDNCIDSIIWDFMYGGDYFAMYDSKILPRRKCAFADRWLQEGLDVIPFLVEGTKKRNVECILTHRIGEVDIDCEENFPEIKVQYPERFIRAWQNLGYPNMEFEENRTAKVELLREALTLFAFDGLDVDFMRTTPFLTPGKQRENGGCLTQFLRDLRAMTLELEEKLGRTILLTARVPDTVELCEAEGIQIQTILEENLLDFLTLGSRTLSPDIEGFRAVCGDMPLYPCHDDGHSSDGYAFPPIEVMRGVFTNWLSRGADGVQTFNWYTAKAENRGFAPETPSFDCETEILPEMGALSYMQGKKKTFVVERRGGYPYGEGASYNNEHKQLPIVLPNYGAEKEVEIYAVKDDGYTPNKIILRLICYGVNTEDALSVSLNDNHLKNGTLDFNHNELQVWTPEPTAESGLYVLYRMRNDDYDKSRKLLKASFEVDKQVLKDGFNKVKIFFARAVPTRAETSFRILGLATVEKVEIDVIY